MVRRRTPRALRMLTWGAAGASVLIASVPALAGLRAGNGEALGAVPAYLPLIAVVLALAALLDISLPLGHRQWQVRGLDIAGAGLLLLCPGPGLWLGAAGAAGLLTTGARLTNGRRWRSMDFATSSALLQTASGSVVTCALRSLGLGPIVAALFGVLAAALIRDAMAAGAVALTARRPLIGLLLPRLPATLWTAAGNGAVALLVGWLLLTVTARALGGADVELVLFGPEGLIRYTGDESGVSERSRTDTSALDAPWVRHLLARGAVRIAADEGRPSCAFSVGTGHALRAVVVARRPLGGSGITRRDTVFALALARQSATWLTPAPEPEIARDPRLEVVREIARRILRSPEPTADPEWSTRLLDEVHALERAIAALLGSAPGGTIPEQRDRHNVMDDLSDLGDPADGAVLDPAQPNPRSGPEWTTTGRLS